MKKRIVLLAIVNCAAFSFHALISYGLTTVAPFTASEPNEAAAYHRLAEALSFLGSGVQNFIQGKSFAADQKTFLLLYCLPLVISTLTFVLLIHWLASKKLELDSGIPRMLFRWATIFAIIVSLSSPVLVQDFWLSAAWGRMVATGQNPYHANIPDSFSQALPLDYGKLHMSYGPLWAVISGLVMFVSGNHALLAGLLLKGVLAAAWIGSLSLIWRLLRDNSIWSQCVGIAMFGWLPLSVIEILGDGHNDVVMVMFALLWLYSLERGRTAAASFSLAASTLIKYASAPLFVLDALHAIKTRRLGTYARHLLLVVVASLLLVGIFYRSPAFFRGVREMESWTFYTPKDAVMAVGGLIRKNLWANRLVGSAFSTAGDLVRLLFLLMSVYFVIQYWKRPERDSFRLASLSVMTAVLFAVAGHIWPWFVLWVLGLAATVPHTTLARWVIGVALPFPFIILAWTVFPEGDPFLKPAIGLYGFSVLWLLATPRRWFPAAIHR